MSAISTHRNTPPYSSNAATDLLIVSPEAHDVNIAIRHENCPASLRVSSLSADSESQSGQSLHRYTSLQRISHSSFPE